MKTVAHLQSLQAIRERSRQVFALGQQSQLEHFDLDLSQLDKVVSFVVDLIKRDYDSIDDVPAHSRWRHFSVGGRKRVEELLVENEKWKQLAPLEKTRRLLDLFVVSVLLDAGAGDKWKYVEKASGQAIGRSEGLAVASFDMFLAGKFSSHADDLHRVDADALLSLKPETIKQAFQVTDGNPLVGVEGRTLLLNRLGSSLKQHAKFFHYPVDSSYRPGNMLFYLTSHETTKSSATGQVSVQMETFWRMIIDGFGDVWPPTRTKIDNVAMGDVWPCSALARQGASSAAHADLVPFHKLSQWLTYSLMEPMTLLMNIHFDNMHLMTGLAEYRNGGLFVDYGVIKLKPESRERGLEFAKKNSNSTVELVPLFEVFDPVIVEWRALTVCLLDLVGEKVCKIYELSQEQLPLVRVLEGGTWKAGREIAAKNRPQTKGPPIQIKSDGTVF